MQESQDIREFRENDLLAALPLETLGRLSPDLEHVVLPPFEILHNFNDPVTHLYFPHWGTVVSTLSTTDENIPVEVAVTGSEGVIGVSGLLGSLTTPSQHLVQVPGTGTRIALNIARREFEVCGLFQRLVLRHTHLLIVQISQSALCNRLHSDEERLSRWLLLSHDRIESNQLPLPRQLLAKMLGRNQSGVGVTSAILQKAGFISYNGGEMTILNREGLEGVACSCYWVVRRQQQALFGK